MLRKPKYALGQTVVFKSGHGVKKGKIVVLDARGTFEQKDEPSYDILVGEETIVYKHILETKIVKIHK